MQKTYNGLELPQNGKPIEYSHGQYQVPDNPIIPFIEGDGTGRDIWKASQRVFDAAVEKAYGGKRQIKWFEIFAGEKAFRQFSTWLPDDSVSAARDLRGRPQREANATTSITRITVFRETTCGTNLLCERQQKSPTRVAMGLTTASSLAKGAINPKRHGRVAWLTACWPITVAGPRPIRTAFPAAHACKN